MDLNDAFVTSLSRGTMAPAGRAPSAQVQMICESQTTTSETPLPPSLYLLRDLPTQSPAVRRGIGASANAVSNQLASAGVLNVSEEAEAMVSNLMAQNLPKSNTRRVLTPRAK